MAEEDVVIRTMQDDIAGKPQSRPVPPPRPTNNPPAVAKPNPAAPPRFQAPPASGGAPPKAVSSSAPVMPPAQTPPPLQFPLPPRPRPPAEALAKVGSPVPAPRSSSEVAFIPRRRRRGFVFWSVVILTPLVLAGAGVAAYFFLMPEPGQQAASTPTVLPSTLSEIIPANAAVVVQYRVTSPDLRGQLLELWQDNSRSLLQGNPKTLLALGSLTEFAYVTLEDNTRPFLLVPKDTLTPEILSTLGEGQSADVSGWQVLHSLDAKAYAQALATGRHTLGFTPATPPAGLEVYLSESALNQLRSRIASPSFAAGLLQDLTVTLAPAASTNALLVNGLASLPAPSPTGSAVIAARADTALLEKIPGDATFVRLGASLEQDITVWQNLATVLHSETLAVPAVAALVGQLNGPYAYYHRAGLDGITDVGLVITLPSTLNPSLDLGDATLEQALTVLLPLISSSSPAATLRFADGLYQNTPLRFVNLAGSNEALDYAIVGNHLLINTSKEGMFAALDTVSARAASVSAASPWQNLMSEWQTIPETEHLFLGSLEYAPLLELLPAGLPQLPFGLAFSRASSGSLVNGAVVLNLTASSPSPTP